MDISFEKICELEPEIAEIYAQARGSKNRMSANLLWQNNLRPRLSTLVGTRARDPQLREYAAFALAMDTVTEALPK